MAGSFETYKAGYRKAWDAGQVRASMRRAAVNTINNHVLPNRARYEVVAKMVRQAGGGTMPWWFVAFVHGREASYQFDRFLGNGQHLSQRTTIVPKGEGPFIGVNAFERGCLRALDIQGFLDDTDWSIERTLWRFEGYNGFGYHGKGVNSPYLWAGTTAYGPPEARGGKFVADHVFNPNAVDQQIGTAMLLKVLIEMKPEVLDDIHETSPSIVPQPSDLVEHGVLWVQTSLNALSLGQLHLVTDGILGRQTKQAISDFQVENSLADTGLPNEQTLDAIELHLTRLPAAQAVAAVVPPAAQPAAPVPSMPAPQTTPATSSAIPPPPLSNLQRLDARVRDRLHGIFNIRA